MYQCNKCTWKGTGLAYVGFDRTGEQFRNLPYGHGVCPQCGVPFIGTIHTSVHELLDLGVLSSGPYVMSERFTVAHLKGCDLDAADVAAVVEIIKQNLPLTVFGLQRQLDELGRLAGMAYQDEQWDAAYTAVVNAFQLFRDARPLEVFNLMASLRLSERFAIQRLVTLPPAPASADYIKPDFGRWQVRDVIELQPGEKFGLVGPNRQHVGIELTGGPYTLCGEWGVKFLFLSEAYASFGSQYRFLCELGLAPYRAGKWDTRRHLIILPENR